MPRCGFRNDKCIEQGIYILCSEDIKNLFILKTQSCYAVYVWPSEKHISLIKGGGTGGGVRSVGSERRSMIMLSLVFCTYFQWNVTISIFLHLNEKSINYNLKMTLHELKIHGLMFERSYWKLMNNVFRKYMSKTHFSAITGYHCSTGTWPYIFFS